MNPAAFRDLQHLAPGDAAHQGDQRGDRAEPGHGVLLENPSKHGESTRVPDILKRE